MAVRVIWILLLAIAAFAKAKAQPVIDADLLIVGGNESGVAAAVQAARLGVKRIVLTNDIEWLGGQFSAEAVGAIDEWTDYQKRRINFSRSGMFLEVIRRIREYNGQQYGVPTPGNALTASDTIEPAAAARIFSGLLAPYSDGGTKQVRLIWPYQPVAVRLDGRRVDTVTFEDTGNPSSRVTVRARITIDSSDWGDVIRLSGARYSAGPDLKSRFGEENAPPGPLGPDRNEMNPITYCMVLREVGSDATTPRPEGYDERTYYGSTEATAAEFAGIGWPPQVSPSRARVFVDTDYPEGIYSGFDSIYTQRRLVDRYHNHLPVGAESILLNWSTQDYPLYNFPQRVVDALDATEQHASQKNIVDMTYAQRKIVFEDAKRYSLGFLYYLQTKIHDKLGEYPQSFKHMKLTDEFGTPDRLPWKPYIREGLRLEALYMLREQDVRSRHKIETEEMGWAPVMPPDNICGFQFSLDFHPTRRLFLGGDPAGPWMHIHAANRNWSTRTARAGLPYRSLVPIDRDALLGASKNLGVSSVVSSAVRLHGQMMLVGQAAGTAAGLCLRYRVEPRQIAREWKLLREMQRLMAFGVAGGPGVALWPYHDATPDKRWFGAANLLAVRGILPGRTDSLDFEPWEKVTRREVARALVRGARSLEGAKPYAVEAQPLFQDVAQNDPDRPYIETLQHWGIRVAEAALFRPDDVADWRTLYDWLKGLGWPASQGLVMHGGRFGPQSPELRRSELALHLWEAIKDQAESFPHDPRFLDPGNDSDKDGIPDLNDPLPFDRDNDNLPDRLDPKIR